MPIERLRVGSAVDGIVTNKNQRLDSIELESLQTVPRRMKQQASESMEHSSFALQYTQWGKRCFAFPACVSFGQWSLEHLRFGVFVSIGCNKDARLNVSKELAKDSLVELDFFHVSDSLVGREPLRSYPNLKPKHGAKEPGDLQGHGFCDICFASLLGGGHSGGVCYRDACEIDHFLLPSHRLYRTSARAMRSMA